MGLFKKKEDSGNTKTSVNVNNANAMRELKSSYTPKSTSTSKPINVNNANQMRELKSTYTPKQTNKSINVNDANKMRELKNSYTPNTSSNARNINVNDVNAMRGLKGTDYRNQFNDWVDKTVEENPYAFTDPELIARDWHRADAERKSAETLLSGETSKGQSFPELLESAFDGGVRLSKEEIDNLGGVIVDKKTGKQANMDYVNALVNDYNSKAEQYKVDSDNLTKGYKAREIGDEDYLKADDDLKKRKSELDKMSQELDGYDYLTGMDYYNWLKNNGTDEDVRSFESYVASYDDSFLQGVTNAYKSAKIKQVNTPFEIMDIAKLYLDKNNPDAINNYLNDSFSAQNNNTANEIAQYVTNGRNGQGFRAYTLNTISTIMPTLINTIDSLMFGNLVGGANSVVQLANKAGNFSADMGGVSTAIETFRQRLSEGNSVDASLWNAIPNGVAEALIERLNVGNVVNMTEFFSGVIGIDMLGAGLFSLPKVVPMLLNVADSAGGEMVEELVGAVTSRLIDNIENSFLGFTGSDERVSSSPAIFDKNTIINFETFGKIGEGGLTDQMIMAGYGAILQGAPNMGKNVINSVKKYNCAGEAIKYYQERKAYAESMGDMKSASMYQQGIDFFTNERRTYENTSVVGTAVQTQADMAEPAPSLEETLNVTANGFRLNVSDEVNGFIENEEFIQRLERETSDALAKRGINIDTNLYTTLDDQTRRNVKEVAKYANALGINTSFDSDENIKEKVADVLRSEGKSQQEIQKILDKSFVDGYYDNSTGRIVLNTNTELGHLSTMIHEITHGTEASKYYGELESFLKENYGNELKRNLKDNKVAYEALSADAQKESVAKTVQDELLLGNEDFVRKLIRYNNSLAYRIYDNIRAMVSSDVKTQLENTFEKAFRDAQNMQSNNELQSQFSFITRELNEKQINNIKDISTNAIEDGKLKTFEQQLDEYSKSKYNRKNRLVISPTTDFLSWTKLEDRILTVSEKVLNKILALKHSDQNLYDVLKNIDNELINNTVIAFDGVGKNEGKKAIIIQTTANETGEPILIAVKEKNIDHNEVEVNDIVTIHKRNSIKDTLSKAKVFYLNEKSMQWLHDLGLQLPSDAIIHTSNDIISNEEGNVNTQSQYREDGSRKDLRAIHNLSLNELEKSLDLGGFAMPSIAITKDSINHSGYGDVSIVFDKDTIDPSRKENEVFGGDAYTSRFPKLEYKISSPDEMFRLYDIEKEYGLRSLGVKYDSGNLEELFNNSDSLEDAKGRLSRMDATKLLFMDSIGDLEKHKDHVKEYIDSGLMNSLIKVQQEQYDAFVDNLVNNMVEQSGLRNNKDIYTPSGNRRSFDQTHDEYNLQNALKIMLDASRGNSRNVETGFGSTGINGMIASQTQQFKNIDDIINNEDRLNDLANEEYANIRQQLSESINNEIYKFVTETGISDGLGVYETYQVGDALAMEMLNAKSDKQALKIASEYYTGKATDEQILDFYHTIQEYKEPLRNMPTRYFEAKPRRIVAPSEWKQAYVPSTASSELIQRLEDLGVEVIEYSDDYDLSRKDAMNVFAKDYQFALGEKGDTQESAQNEGQYFDYGMNPVRNVDILRNTEAGPTSRFWNNLANSQYASDEEAQRIKKMVEDGLGAYEQTSRKKQNEEAKKMLRNMGMEDAFKYMMNSDSVSTMDVDNALGRTLLNEMRLKGLESTENYHQLESRMQWRATMQGQALEAWKGFRDSTPEGQIVTIRSEIERIQQGLNERYGDRAYNIELDEDLIAEYLRARTDEERDAIREQIARDVAKQIPPTAMEQLNSFRHLSMLFNPRTWVKNRLANTAFGYINEGTRAVRSVLETIASEIGKNNENSVFHNMERQAGTYNPFSKEDRAQLKRFKERYHTRYKNIDMKYSAIDAGNVLLGTGFGEEVSRYRDSFTFKFLNKLSEINAKMMSDAPGMSTAYAKSLIGYLKANNLDIDTMSEEQIQKAEDFAINEAKYATFNSYNKLASDIAKFSNDGSKARRIIIESFLPFKRTPLNLLRTGFRYTPVGLAETMTYELSQLKKGKITANQFIDNMAQGMTGSALMALGMLLSHMGIFKTKDDDPDRKQYYDQELGEQEYSINWDGGSYTIDWLDPMIVPLAMGAELNKYVQRGEYSLDDAINMVASIADPMFETSMLSGISKNLSNYSQGTTQWWGKIAQNAVTNYMSQYVPSILGAVARTIDDTRRSTYTDKGTLDKFVRTTKNKLPLVSMTNEPYINRRGQEEKSQDLGMGMAGRAILNFVSPGYYQNKDIDKYDEELYRLYDETGDINSLPSNATKTLTYNDENYKFTPEQYTQWQETRWQTEAEYVNQFIDSNAYQNLTDEERVDTIKDIRSYAQKVAKKEFLESQGYEYTDDKELAESDDKYVYDKQLSGAQGAVDNDIELYSYFDYLNNAGSKQAEKVKYLEESGLSQKQKEYLWSLNDYKKSYEDVYKKVFGEGTGTSSKKKSSSKNSKKVSSSKSTKKKKTKKVSTSGAGSGGKIAKSGKVSSNLPQRMVSNPINTTKVADTFLKAYSSSMNKTRKASTGGSSTVVCPKCGNKVSSASGRCPICGAKL